MPYASHKALNGMPYAIQSPKRLQRQRRENILGPGLAPCSPDGCILPDVISSDPLWDPSHDARTADPASPYRCSSSGALSTLRHGRIAAPCHGKLQGLEPSDLTSGRSITLQAHSSIVEHTCQAKIFMRFEIGGELSVPMIPGRARACEREVLTVSAALW